MRILVLSLLFSMSALAQGQFLNCNGTEVPLLHEAAVRLISNTQHEIQKNHSPLLGQGLKKYFGINSISSPLVATVYANIKKVAKNAAETVYKCHTEERGLWCRPNIRAIVPPPKDKVHLCPGYFEFWRRERTATLLHEWFHRWGGGSINYLPETYCYESSGLAPEKLIRNSDQYMLFIYFVGTGGEILPCF